MTRHKSLEALRNLIANMSYSAADEPGDFDYAATVDMLIDKAREIGPPPSEARYAVVEGSESWHCCFEATVVDTATPLMIGGAQFEGRFSTVCETFERGHAEAICAAMNSAGPSREEEGG